LGDQFSLDEIKKKIIFDLPKDKAAGPDGFLIEFFNGTGLPSLVTYIGALPPSTLINSTYGALIKHISP
jgi:hypothetical protein